MTHIPFTYLIGWSALGKFYYGVRYSKSCTPAQLWTTYFTSSKHVKQFAHDHGEPDIIEIRRTFSDAAQARSWEHRVLRRLKVIYRLDFLNMTDNMSVSNTGIKHSDETRRKISESLKKIPGRVWTDEQRAAAAAKQKGIIFSEAHCQNIANARKGMQFSNEHRSAISSSQLGRKASLETRKKQSVAIRAAFQNNPHLGIEQSSKSKNIWANRTAEERAAIGRKISESKKAKLNQKLCC